MLKKFLFFSIICFVLFEFSWALTCGLSEDLSYETQQKLKSCSDTKRDNQNFGYYNDEDSNESDISTTFRSTRRNLRPRFNRDNRRKAHSNSNGYNHQQYNPNNYNNDQSSSHNETMNCNVLACIFKQLRMADMEGFPNRSMMLQVLMKNTQNRELRSFVQQATEDCFQLLNMESKSDACVFTTHLIQCLAEKGRNNCDDWKNENFSEHLPFQY